MLCIMLVKIMAFIFHFYSSKILGRKRKSVAVNIFNETRPVEQTFASFFTLTCPNKKPPLQATNSSKAMGLLEQ